MTHKHDVHGAACSYKDTLSQCDVAYLISGLNMPGCRVRNYFFGLACVCASVFESVAGGLV